MFIELIHSTDDAVSDWVTERVLREDKTHSTGLTMHSAKKEAFIFQIGLPAKASL